MKNFKRLTKRSLKSINGGAIYCPPITDTCVEWCGWTPWQKSHCLLGELCDPC
ncbi:bacteriocin-like protein [Chryseobacterium sp. CH1]|uniref:bacteriocin-like protein n=1 Tax=unclassified Chryseobacterium TaxID=2593645 RepID=UPI0039774D15